MNNYLIRSITTAVWMMLLCLQSSGAQEVDTSQTKKNLLETLQSDIVDERRQMELYVDLYDLSDNEADKYAYIKKSLELAVRQKDQTYIFETLDILCRNYKDEADSLHYYWRIGEEHLTGPYKDFYMAWLKAYPSVCKMDEAEEPNEANEEIARYKQHKANLSDKSQEVQWEMILCSAMECVSYFSPSVTSSEDRITHLRNIHQLVSGLPFEVSYKFDWYYLTRIEYLLRADGKTDETVKAVEALEQLEQLYDNQFELPFYKRRAYLRSRNREALRMGVYSEMLYFGDVIGRERMDEVYSRMEAYYQNGDSETSKDMLQASFRYYSYTRQYGLAMQTVDDLLARTDTADTNGRTELLAKKINLITQWKQHYKEGFDAFWEYTSLMEGSRVEETNQQLAEMRSLFEVDKLKIEQAELQARYHRIALAVLVILLLIILIWSLYQYRLTKRLKATKEALILSNKKVAEESERAKESDRMKTEFLQSMCHEIRTPLNAVCGFSTLLLNEDLSREEREEFPAIIEKNSNQLTELFEDILHVSDLSSSLELFPMERVDVLPVCVEILGICRERAKNTALAYVFESALDECPVTTNIQYLQRVVEHLLGNAAKFTASGTIRMSLAIVEGKVRIAVSDTGIGIPAEKAEYIFDRFTKLDDFMPGTGLGLYSCRLIVTRLGGSIYLDTSYRDGACFCIDLPGGE
ncbi:sensor histidine kinase [Bacteroides sp.]|uniref:sensor histidine kinase n=1 Tax=Bacteroides sp. TaxID=29523 RepID=UPI003AB50D9E